MTTRDLQPGDIVFFQWKGWDETPDADPDFEEFSHLAGYIQDLAYDRPIKRYWHHCEVMVSDTESVGFRQTGSAVGSALEDTITKDRLIVPPDQTIAVLRPDPSQVTEVVRRALATRGATYSVGALLAFGFATQRRLFVGRGREALTPFVAGAYHFSRQPTANDRSRFIPVDRQHTCVSAVLKAVGSPTIKETPPRTTPAPISDDAKNKVKGPFQRIRDRVSGGGAAQGVDIADDVLSIDQIEGGFGLDQGVEVPGFVQATKDYLNLINAVATALMTDNPGRSLPEVGAENPLDEDDTPAWLVSPAMLWDHLGANGFEPIEV